VGSISELTEFKTLEAQLDEASDQALRRWDLDRGWRWLARIPALLARSARTIVAMPTSATNLLLLSNRIADIARAAAGRPGGTDAKMPFEGGPPRRQS
jgi:hypothetical protein